MGSNSSKQETELNSTEQQQPAPVQYKTSIYGFGTLKHPVKKQNGSISKKKKSKQSNKKDSKAAGPAASVQPRLNSVSQNLNVRAASPIGKPLLNSVSQNPNGRAASPIEKPVIRKPSIGKPVIGNPTVEKTAVGKPSIGRRVIANPPNANTPTSTARRPYQSNPNLTSNSTFLTSSAEPMKPRRTFAHHIPTPFKLADELSELKISKSRGLTRLNEVGISSNGLDKKEFPLGWKSISTSSQTTTGLSGSIPGSKLQFRGTLLFYGQYRCSTCKKYWRSSYAQDGVPQNCSKCGTSTFPRR